MGRTNNQTSVSDADREIPTLGSTENSRNSVNPVLSVGLLGQHRILILDSICPCYYKTIIRDHKMHCTLCLLKSGNCSQGMVCIRRTLPPKRSTNTLKKSEGSLAGDYYQHTKHFRYVGYYLTVYSSMKTKTFMGHL